MQSMCKTRMAHLKHVVSTVMMLLLRRAPKCLTDTYHTLAKARSTAVLLLLLCGPALFGQQTRACFCRAMSYTQQVTAHLSVLHQFSIWLKVLFATSLLNLSQKHLQLLLCCLQNKTCLVCNLPLSACCRWVKTHWTVICRQDWCNALLCVAAALQYSVLPTAS